MEYKFTNAYHKESIETLKKWIAVPSVLDEDAKDTPFGDEIQNMLELALETFKDLGFETYIDEDGYYGYAETGQGEEMLGILCHLDVVPAPNPDAWESDPFELDVRDETIYGRGTQDDKGPTITALYAVKALMDQGYEFDRRIRFIFDTDEETIWRGINRYIDNGEELPTEGFAPDSGFPLINAEKGLLQSYLVGPGSKDLAVDTGGTFNVVPDAATYTGDDVDEIAESLTELGYEFDQTDEAITVSGKSIHSKDAGKGINAVTRLTEALGKHYEHPMLEFLNEQIKNDPHATTIFGNLEDEMTGKLTANVANIIINEDESRIGFDFRIPVTVDKDELVSKLEEVAGDYKLTYDEFDYLASTYVPADSELVQTLLSVYRDLTGNMTEPMSSGGATLARAMKNCVAFGALAEDEESTAHEVNEHMSLKNFYDAMEIYATAVKELAVK